MAGPFGTFLLIFGLIWSAIVGYIYVTNPADAQSPGMLIFAAPGALSFVAGLILTIIGIVQNKKYRELVRIRQEKEQEIEREGISTQGQVTFVDRNYAYLLNNNPVYSIIEYKFVDHRGIEHTGKNYQVPSEYVIRSQIVVGSEVELKYLTRDPEENRLVLPQ